MSWPAPGWPGCGRGDRPSCPGSRGGAIVAVQGGDAGAGHLGVLPGLHAGNADRADQAAVEIDGLAAFQGHDRHGKGGDAALVDHVFVDLAGLAAEDAGPGLFRRDPGAHERGAVHALQPHAVAAGVADGDADVPAVAAGFGLGCARHAARVFECQDSDGLHAVSPGGRHGFQRTRMARKSLTLVSVGPVTRESPSRSKKPWPSLSSRWARGGMPAAQARARVSGPIRAPAISSWPSTPSVSPAGMPAAWRPARPWPRTVAVVPPPDSSTQGGGMGWPWARSCRAMPLRALPTSRASPSMRSPSSSGATPASRATEAAASRAI